MKILNISLDKKLFETGSDVERRVFEYTEIFDRFDILVLCEPGHEKKGSERIAIWPTNSKGRIYYFFDALRLGGEMIEKYGYDLISSQDPFETGLVAWLLAKKYSIKFQVQLHGDFFGSPYFRGEKFLNRCRYYLGRFIVRRADGIRAVSKRIKRSLLEMGIEEEKIAVAPIFTELGIRDYKLLKNEKRDEFIFLTVGRLVPVKNIGMQIGAMAEIIKEYPEAELWIVGDGGQKKRLEDSVKRQEIGDKVRFFGWRDDLAEYYQQADVFLLTSNYEGWGLAVLEAAGYGLPIIMTDVGCADEVIKNNESGIIIPVGDRQKLMKGMVKLIKDENLRQGLGGGAWRAVLSLPDKGKSLEMYKKACEKIFQ